MLKRLLLLLVVPLIGSVMAAQQPEKDAMKLLEPQAVTIDTPDDFMSNSESFWIMFNQFLRGTDIKTVELIVTGFGGNVSLLNRTVQAIQDYQKAGGKIIMRVIGPTISAHAILLCYADTIIIDDGGSYSFHQMRSYFELFGGLLVVPGAVITEANPLQHAMLNKCVKSKLITKEDLLLVLSGNRVAYMNYGNGNMQKAVIDEQSAVIMSVLSFSANALLSLGVLMLVLSLVADAIRKPRRK